MNSVEISERVAETLIPDLHRALKPRPVKWCRVCHRRHRRGMPCGFVKVKRRAKSGRTVTRLVLRSISGEIEATR